MARCSVDKQIAQCISCFQSAKINNNITIYHANKKRNSLQRYLRTVFMSPAAPTQQGKNSISMTSPFYRKSPVKTFLVNVFYGEANIKFYNRSDFQWPPTRRDYHWWYPYWLPIFQEYAKAILQILIHIWSPKRNQLQQGISAKGAAVLNEQAREAS